MALKPAKERPAAFDICAWGVQRSPAWADPAFGIHFEKIYAPYSHNCRQPKRIGISQLCLNLTTLPGP